MYISQVKLVGVIQDVKAQQVTTDVAIEIRFAPTFDRQYIASVLSNLEVEPYVDLPFLIQDIMTSSKKYVYRHTIPLQNLLPLLLAFNVPLEVDNTFNYNLTNGRNNSYSYKRKITPAERNPRSKPEQGVLMFLRNMVNKNLLVWHRPRV